MMVKKNWDRLERDYLKMAECLSAGATNVRNQKGIMPSLALLYWPLLVFIRLAQTLWWCETRCFLAVVWLSERRGEYDDVFGNEKEETT